MLLHNGKPIPSVGDVVKVSYFGDSYAGVLLEPFSKKIGDQRFRDQALVLIHTFGSMTERTTFDFDCITLSERNS